MTQKIFFSSYAILILLMPPFAWSVDESDPAAAPVQSTQITPPVAQPEPVVLVKPPAEIPAVKVPSVSVPPKPTPAITVQPDPVSSTTINSPSSSKKSQKKSLTPVPVKAEPEPEPIAAPQPLPPLLQPQHDVFSDTDSSTVNIEFFVREGCQYCDKAKEFLTKLKKLQPYLKIAIRDVRKEPAALELLKRMAQNQGGVTIDYPAFVVSGHLIVGFADESSTAQLILDTLSSSQQDSNQDAKACTSGKELSCGLIPPAPVTKQQAKTLRILGYEVPLLHVGLPIFTLLMGLLDGMNFGSTWVLVMMISLLAPLKNRTTMFAVAGTFIAIQGLIYFIFMAAWLNLFLSTGTSRLSEIVIASIAIIAGIVYFKKYLYLGQGISINSNEIAKPGIYTRIRKIVQAKSLPETLIATILLAVIIQIAEFSFTSVFPAFYTRMLTIQHLSNLNNYGYLLLYDVAYMLDDVILLFIGTLTLRQLGTPEKSVGILKLVSAFMLLSLGIYLLSSQF